MWLQRLERWLLFDAKAESIAQQSNETSQRGVINRTVEGLHLRWYRLVSEIDAPVILYAHGNGGSIETRDHIVTMFRSTKRVNLVMFDYSGFGSSEGVPSQPQILQDILTVYDYLTDPNGHPFGFEHAIPAQQIIAWGESLGGAVVAYLAQHRSTIRGVVLMSSFPNLRWMARHLYGTMAAMAFGWGFIDHLDTLQRLRDGSIKVPVVILHSHDDEFIPIEAAVELVQAKPSPTTRLIVIKGTHERPVILPKVFTEIWDGLYVQHRRVNGDNL